MQSSYAKKVSDVRKIVVEETYEQLVEATCSGKTLGDYMGEMYRAYLFRSLKNYQYFFQNPTVVNVTLQILLQAMGQIFALTFMT